MAPINTVVKNNYVRAINSIDSRDIIRIQLGTVGEKNTAVNHKQKLRYLLYFVHPIYNLRPSNPSPS